MQMAMKTFLRISQQEMRRGFMGMMLKLKCNRRSGWGKGLLVQNSTHESIKDQGDVGCVFDWKGIVHHEFVPRGQMGNKQLYQEILARLRDAMRRKRPELWENHTWMLHHDNAPAHASLLFPSYLAKYKTSVVLHSPYSPNLTPAEFFLFPKLNTTLKGRRFQTIEEIQENAIRELCAITESAFQEAFQEQKKCRERCIASRGDYFAGDSA